MCDASGATGMADVIGTPTPEKVEWPYLKKWAKKKSRKDQIIRRVTNKVVKEEKEVNEVIDMNNQKLPENWLEAKRLWNKLIELKKVYPTDHEGFLTFEKFYSGFISKFNKEPTVDEVIKKFVDAR